jgi:hypothetical protein
MRAEPFYFRGNGGDIDSEVNYGVMRAADVSNGRMGAIMFGMANSPYNQLFIMNI